MPDAKDMDLVREYAARNSEPAFETLVRRHVSLVYSVALRQTGKPAQAEEITQAVFLILARKAARLRPDTVLAAWLHETARFVSASFLRGEARRRRREQEAYMQSQFQESAADPAWEQLAPLLDEAIGRLGKADRNAVVLRFFQNKSAREIAAALNVHESAAQKRLNRAVEKLRAHFLKRGVAVSAGALIGSLSVNSVHGAPAHLAASVMAVSAKGTAISTSTLTLIKGALKIMAWTKAKTAIVVGASVLLAAGTTTITVKGIAHHREESVWSRITRCDLKQMDSAPPTVSIRPTRYTPQVAGAAGSAGKVLALYQPFDVLLARAYDVSPCRILPLTPLPQGDFDFIASVPQRQKEALQELIRQKFGITGRRETRETVSCC
jgi:RNA polymerase sigma factor (sigma-70 family)